MCLLFKTLYLHCTCSNQLKLHQDCVHYIIAYLFNVIQHYTILNSKDKAFKYYVHKDVNYPPTLIY